MFAFDDHPLLEVCAGPDEGDEVGAVDGPPAGLGGLDELEGHGEAGGSGAGALGDLCSEPDRGEGRLDRVGGPQVDPVLGGEVEERQQRLKVVDDLGDRFRLLGPELGRERVGGGRGVAAVLGITDLRQGPASGGLSGLRERVEDVADPQVQVIPPPARQGPRVLEREGAPPG